MDPRIIEALLSRIPGYNTMRDAASQVIEGAAGLSFPDTQQAATQQLIANDPVWYQQMQDYSRGVPVRPYSLGVPQNQDYLPPKR